MPTVESQVTVNCPPDQVFRVAQNVEKFPEFMPDVVSIDVLEREGNRVVTKWVGRIAELRMKVKWTEEDLWDPEALTCRFRQLEGDYGKFEGLWQFTPEGDGTLFKSTLEIEYNVPMIGPLIRGLIAKKAKENLDRTLAAIKQMAESSAAAT